MLTAFLGALIVSATIASTLFGGLVTPGSHAGEILFVALAGATASLVATASALDG
jgi:hypothetical protein